jgi:uncharacterized membrane protein
MMMMMMMMMTMMMTMIMMMMTMMHFPRAVATNPLADRHLLRYSRTITVLMSSVFTICNIATHRAAFPTTKAQQSTLCQASVVHKPLGAKAPMYVLLTKGIQAQLPH